MSDYAIHPLCAMSPSMSAEQFAEFKGDIQVNGQREPVKVWCEQIIDGRHRAQACQELGLELRIVTVALTEAELPGYVLSLNAMRNHMDAGQRAFYIADLTKHRPRGWNLKGGDAGSVNLPILPTVAEAAKVMGVSPSLVHKAKRIQAVAAPEVAEAVKSGKLSLHAATQIAKQVPKSEQSAAVERWVAEPKKRFRKVVPVTGGKVHSPPRRKEPIEDLVDRAVTNLDVATQALETYGERSAPSSDQRASWESILDRAAGIIRRFRAHLKEVAA